MKVVINKCYGGFSLSKDATLAYIAKKFPNAEVVLEEDYEWVNAKVNGEYFVDRDISRNDPILVEVVEQLGKEADGSYAKLKVIEIPDNILWQIEEYDGQEWVSEVHRTWG